MAGRVTIQDIAEALGLSRNTVSKALNNTGSLSDATRERVLQKAMEMGYKQFSYASVVSAVTSAQDSSPRPDEGVIAILSGSFIGSSHFATTMLDRFQREISHLGYSTSIHRPTSEELKALRLPATLNPKKIVGLICFEAFDLDYARMICELGLPTLFVDTPVNPLSPPLKSDILLMENIMSVQAIVREMARQGKTGMGFIGDPNHCRSFRERYQAYTEALQALGMARHPEFDITEDDETYWQHLTERIAAMPGLPEVFFCANDFVAIEVLRALRELGYSVPENVWLCGFDDSPESSVLTPSLTTVHIHSQIMGFSAAQLLISRIKEPTLHFRTVYTETTPIFRESTGHKRSEA